MANNTIDFDATTVSINTTSASHWTRLSIYRILVSRFKENRPDLALAYANLLEKRAYMMSAAQRELVFATNADQHAQQLQAIEIELASLGAVDLTGSWIKWDELQATLMDTNDFQVLFCHASGGMPDETEAHHFAQALLLEQLARRHPQDHSLENLGLVNLAYPGLDKATLPLEAEALSIPSESWKDFLKIAVDYLMRYRFHFVYDPDIDLFTTHKFRSTRMFAPDAKRILADRWPQYNHGSMKQHRLVLLLCAGLGWHDANHLTATQAAVVDKLLHRAWETLREQVFVAEKDGYRLDFFTDKVRVELGGHAYLCPVTLRLLDRVFMGYSPWIKGQCIAEIEAYRLP